MTGAEFMKKAKGKINNIFFNYPDEAYELFTKAGGTTGQVAGHCRQTRSRVVFTLRGATRRGPPSWTVADGAFETTAGHVVQDATDL